jgi:hypothetical protein
MVGREIPQASQALLLQFVVFACLQRIKHLQYSYTVLLVRDTRPTVILFITPRCALRSQSSQDLQIYQRDKTIA